MNTKDTKDEQPAQPPASPEELAKLGWQSIECPFCGSSGAQAFPKPAQQQEIDELTTQRDKLADILTRTANALKGQPPELVSHSWHDLPEVAQQLKSAQQQEPVGVVGTDIGGTHLMYGTQYVGKKPDKKTAIFFKDVPVGSPLYTSPQPLPGDYTALERALTRLQKRYADLESGMGKPTGVKPWVGLVHEETHEAIGTAGSDLLELAKLWSDNKVHVYQFDNEARKIIEAVLRRASAKLREKNNG